MTGARQAQQMPTPLPDGPTTWLLGVILRIYFAVVWW